MGHLNALPSLPPNPIWACCPPQIPSLYLCGTAWVGGMQGCVIGGCRCPALCLNFIFLLPLLFLFLQKEMDIFGQSPAETGVIWGQALQKGGSSLDFAALNPLHPRDSRAAELRATEHQSHLCFAVLLGQTEKMLLLPTPGTQAFYLASSGHPCTNKLG